MKLTELFKKGQKFWVEDEDEELWCAGFKNNGREIQFSAEDMGRGRWHVEFFERNNEKQHNFTTKMTGSGGEIEVMGTIKDIFLKFVADVDPKYMEFTAKSGDRGRVAVYQRMLKRFTPTGYTVKQMEDPHAVDQQKAFVITKNTKVNEVLDSTVKGNTFVNTATEYKSSAEIGGRIIRFVAYRDEAYSDGKDRWEIEFFEVKKGKTKTTSDLTGSGSALKVLSFVRDELEVLIAQRKPLEISFSSKDSDGARTTVYARVFDKLLSKEYETDHHKSGNSTRFLYIRK